MSKNKQLRRAGRTRGHDYMTRRLMNATMDWLDNWTVQWKRPAPPVRRRGRAWPNQTLWRSVRN